MGFKTIFNHFRDKPARTGLAVKRLGMKAHFMINSSPLLSSTKKKRILMAIMT
jgi:hypothetical protein